jgi:phosphate-selective porin OprO/OprP
MKSIRYLRALLLFAVFAGVALGQPPPGPASAADVAALRQQLEALQQAVSALSQGQPLGTDETVKALQEQLSALEQKVKVLEREKEIEKEAAAEKAKTAPLITANPKDGFGFKSADNAFTLRVGGIIAYDFGFFDQDRDLILGFGDEQDGTGFRNARLNFQGTVFNDIYYKMEVEFAGQNGTDTPSFFETYVALNNIPYFGDNKGQLRLGHFREPFSMDELTPTGTGTFQERSLNSAFNPAYNPGIMWHDSLLGPEKQERLYYALGIFKTADSWPSSNDSDEDQGFAFTARVAGLPYYAYNGDQLIHVGAGYSKRNPDGAVLGWAARPETSLSLFRYADTEKFPNFRLSNARADDVEEFNAELAAAFGRWTFQSEYTLAKVDTTFDHTETFDGYYAQLEYFLTDDHRPYRHDIATFDRVTPKNPFKWGKDGGWGAWQVALRYAAIDLSDGGVIGGEQNSITAGINWFLNTNTRLSINYVHNNVENDLLDADMDGLELRAQVMF